ncbi:MAG TPA: hypothetical protein P5250_04370, partial [Bacteroidales bacterium]|nr:hypothetical protein [Bacteroidales bacterium]
VVYTSDFIPSSAHIPIHYIASFDIQPLISMQEKEAFLEEALSNNYILFFEHDSCVECCTLKMTPKGIRVDKLFKISDLY